VNILERGKIVKLGKAMPEYQKKARVAEGRGHGAEDTIKDRSPPKGGEVERTKIVKGNEGEQQEKEEIEPLEKYISRERKGEVSDPL